MKNKEIKKGDRILVCSQCVDKNSGYLVSSVKKEKTLVTVVVDVPKMYVYKPYQITMYGHVSSSMLSGFDVKFGNSNLVYTCDYSLIEIKTGCYETNKKLQNAGKALLNLVRCFKEL